MAIRLEELTTDEVLYYYNKYFDEYEELRDSIRDDLTYAKYTPRINSLKAVIRDCEDELEYRKKNTPVSRLSTRDTDLGGGAFYNGGSSLHDNGFYRKQSVNGSVGKTMYGEPIATVFDRRQPEQRVNGMNGVRGLHDDVGIVPPQKPTVPDGYYPITDLNKMPFINRTVGKVEWGISDTRTNPIEPNRIVKKSVLCTSLGEVTPGVVSFVAVTNKVVIAKTLDANASKVLLDFLKDSGEDAEDKFKKLETAYNKDSGLVVGLLNHITLEVNRNGPCDGGWWIQNNVPINVVDGIHTMMMGGENSDGVFGLADSDNNRAYRANYTKLISNVTKRLNDLEYDIGDDDVTITTVLPIVAIDNVSKLFGSRQTNDGKSINVTYNGYDVATVKDEYFSRLWELLNAIHTKILNGVYENSVKYYNMFYIVDSGDPHGKKWRAVVKTDEVLIMRD